MIIFLYGPDTYRSQQKLKEFKKKFIKEIDPSQLNITTLCDGKFNIDEFKKNLTTTPFLAKKRMLIVENLIASHPTKEVQKKVWELLRKNDDNIIVIFLEREISSHERKNNYLFRSLSIEKYASCFDLLGGEKLQAWYTTQFQFYGLKINRPSKNFLMNLVGNDLWRASREIQKLASYKRVQDIQVDDIKSFIADTLNDDIFELIDSLGQKNKKLSIQLTSNLLKQNVDGSEILNKMIWFFKNMILAKSLIGDDTEHLNSQDLATRLKLHPYVAKKMMAQSRNYALEELKKIYHSLVELDLKMKTTNLSHHLLFQCFFLNIISPLHGSMVPFHKT